MYYDLFQISNKKKLKITINLLIEIMKYKVRTYYLFSFSEIGLFKKLISTKEICKLPGII